MLKKKITLIMLVLFIGSTAMTQGIQFEAEGTPFAEVLAKAKKENKMVFMDCYTTWCGPCKKIAKEIFPLEEVGDYFNDKFVSIQVDMEKGEGLELGKRFKVQAYPTLLFINPEGEEVHRATGAGSAESFLEDAKITFDPSKQMGALDERYAMGNRDIDLIFDYVNSKMSAVDMQGAYDVVKEYVEQAEKEDLIHEKALKMMVMLRGGGSSVIQYASDEYYYIMDNRDKIVAMDMGERMYFSVLSGAQVAYLMKVSRKVASLEELDQEITEATTGLDYGPNYERLRGDMHFNYYIAKEQYDVWYNSKMESFKKREAQIDPGRAGMMYGQLFQQIATDPKLENVDDAFMNRVVKDCEACLEANPDDLGLYYQMAALYVKISDKAAAQETFDVYADKLKARGSWNPGSPNHEMIDKLQKSIEAL